MKNPAKMVKFTYYSLFFLKKSPENYSFFQQDVGTGRNTEEVAAKVGAPQGYKDVIFLRGGHLSYHFH